MPDEPETEIEKAKKQGDLKKRAAAYIKGRIEDLERSMASNYAKGFFVLAAQDARRLASNMEVLADINPGE